MKLHIPIGLPKTSLGDSLMGTKKHVKKYPNHSKHPRLSKSGKSVMRGFNWRGIKQINEFHAKRMLADKVLRIKLETAK